MGFAYACQPILSFSVFITFGGTQANGHSVEDTVND